MLVGCDPCGVSIGSAMLGELTISPAVENGQDCPIVGIPMVGEPISIPKAALSTLMLSGGVSIVGDPVTIPVAERLLYGTNLARGRDFPMSGDPVVNPSGDIGIDALNATANAAHAVAVLIVGANVTDPPGDIW